ncbi:phosphatase PAP2 family protein [Paracoccus sp. Z118]|uniref:phosphatase PAP2 family protein n=1 Tax=Paracoccus sp. Z118 TaxID=2851017 RepID=UPI001C2C39BD|nr:phosphatase PAP2 family protein [Paracoccus sp. Z118]MBV0892739.1 phosphatase PAP2 family protein [Paracoccus sp. Z118]
MENNIIDDLHEADVALSVDAGEMRHDPAVRTVGALSEIADQPPAFTLAALAVIGGIAIGRPRLTKGGARVLLSLFIATQVKAAIKSKVVRTRPYKLLDEGEYETGLDGPDEADYNSFPSGHTANAVAAARAISRVAPGAGAPLWLGAAAVGAVQVPRASHHALDVVAGAAVGLLSEALAHAAFGLLGGERKGGRRRR